MKIRMENTEDHDAVREVNLGAFPGEEEVLLVEKLRRNGGCDLTGCIEDNKIVGHILFTPSTIENGDDSFPALALALWRFYPNFKDGV